MTLTTPRSQPPLDACASSPEACPLDERDLWPAQVKAIRNLEKSLAGDRPRALIQMATGSGKTFTAVTAVYRLSSTPARGGSSSSSTAPTSAGRR